MFWLNNGGCRKDASSEAAAAAKSRVVECPSFVWSAAVLMSMVGASLLVEDGEAP